MQKEVDTYFASVNQQSSVAGDSLPNEELLASIMDLFDNDSANILLNAKVVDLAEGLPVSLIDSELVSETVSINLGNDCAFFKVSNLDNAWTCGSPHKKCAKKILFQSALIIRINRRCMRSGVIKPRKKYFCDFLKVKGAK